MNVMSSPTGSASRRHSRSIHGAPTRVEKSHSMQNSPTGLGRRKIGPAIKKYVTLEDRWDMVFGSLEHQQPEDISLTSRSETTPSSRPFSWHPHSTYSSDAFGFDSFDDVTSTDSCNPSPASGHVSAPAIAYLSALAECKKEQYAAPGLSTTEQTTVTSPHLSSQEQNLPELTFAEPYYMGPVSTFTSNPRIESESSEFLPTDEATDDSIKDSGDVLVGMGLYDPPNYESMLMSGFGKGLKLEETWQPPEDIEEDSSDDESVDEPTEQEVPAHQNNKSTTQQYWSPPSAHQPTTRNKLLSTDATTYMNERWYHQLKRPTPQATGLGYGWLHPAQC